MDALYTQPEIDSAWQRLLIAMSWWGRIDDYGAMEALRAFEQLRATFTEMHWHVKDSEPAPVPYRSLRPPVAISALAMHETLSAFKGLALERHYCYGRWREWAGAPAAAPLRSPAPESLSGDGRSERPG